MVMGDSLFENSKIDVFSTFGDMREDVLIKEVSMEGIK
jgi:hypothetical protein